MLSTATTSMQLCIFIASCSLLLVLSWEVGCVDAFASPFSRSPAGTGAITITTRPPSQSHLMAKNDRREFLATSSRIATATVGIVGIFGGASNALAVDDGDNGALILELVESREKLKQVPDLLKANQWDSVRTILKTPPVNNLWNMGDGKNPLMKIAKATDQFELIELKDELGVSLQMCDQLTYDNVFVYYQPGNGKVKVKEPTDLALKALSQLSDAIDLAKDAVK